MLTALLCIAVVVAAFGAEALLGWWKLRTDVMDSGWRLVQARWRRFMGVRQAIFRVQIDAEKLHTARAYVGGPFAGPLFSSNIWIEWSDGREPASYDTR